MLVFYWRLGKDIADFHAESRWGSGFFGTLSRDLKKEIPDARGFSPRNLRYMKRFYELRDEATNGLRLRFRQAINISPLIMRLGTGFAFLGPGY